MTIDLGTMSNIDGSLLWYPHTKLQSIDLCKRRILAVTCNPDFPVQVEEDPEQSEVCTLTPSHKQGKTMGGGGGARNLPHL